jgi:hypothetical protein
MTGEPQPDLETLMSAADQALYRAKDLGRNRIELEKTMLRDAKGGFHPIHITKDASM